MAVVAAAAVEKEGCFVEKAEAEAEAETEMGFAVVELKKKMPSGFLILMSKFVSLIVILLYSWY